MGKYNRKNGKEKRIETSSKTSKSRLSDLERIRPDYSVYRFSCSEIAKYVLIFCGIDLCISYLFFYSWIAFIVLFPGILLFFKEQKKCLLQKRYEEIKLQFLDGIEIVAASLQAGYSAENAVHEAVRELQKIQKEDSIILREFRLIDVQLTMNRSLEELLMDFGRRSHVDDIQSFVEVFQTAKRSGGDLLAIIRNTASCIRQKQETMMEIETCLSGKVMEQNIMSVIPIGILAYIKLSSPEFIESMYGNLTGTIVMSICFLVYALAYFWGQKIVRIEV